MFSPPGSHPSYNNEWQLFWERKCRERGPNIKEQDVLDEWYDFFVIRIDQMHKVEVAAKRQLVLKECELTEAEVKGIELKRTRVGDVPGPSRNEGRDRGKQQQGGGGGRQQDSAGFSGLSNKLLAMAQGGGDGGGGKQFGAAGRAQGGPGNNFGNAGNNPRNAGNNSRNPGNNSGAFGSSGSNFEFFVTNKPGLYGSLANQQGRGNTPAQSKPNFGAPEPKRTRFEGPPPAQNNFNSFAGFERPSRFGGQSIQPQTRANFNPQPANVMKNFMSLNSNVKLIPTLRILSTLETEIGLMAPKILELLSKALVCERTQPDSSEELLFSPENYNLVEMVKEKLLGMQAAGLIPTQKFSAVEKSMSAIEALLQQQDNLERIKGSLSKAGGSQQQQQQPSERNTMDFYQRNEQMMARLNARNGNNF